MSTRKAGSLKLSDTVQLSPVDAAADLTGVLPTARGGTGFGSFVQGDLLYGLTAGNTLAKLAAGSDGHVLTLASGLPAWQAPAGGGAWSIITKDSDEARASTTTFADDGALVVALAASSRYIIEIRAWFLTANATMDYKYGIVYSGTTNSVYNKRVHAAAGAITGTDNEFTNAAVGLTAPNVTATTSGVGYVNLDVLIHTNTAGTFAFQWAQVTSNGSDLTCLAGSYLQYKKHV